MQLLHTQSIAGSSPAITTKFKLRGIIMSRKETLDKAYGNIPSEVGFSIEMNLLPGWRGIKYYWYKLIRRATR